MQFESLEKQEIHSVIWVWSENQLADCLTKDGASRKKFYVTLNGIVKLKKIIYIYIYIYIYIHIYISTSFSLT